MERNIELRSTYLYSDNGLGTLQLNNSSNSTILEKVKNSSNQQLLDNNQDFHKKNEFAVATQMSKTIKESLDNEMKQIVQPHSSKKLTSIVRQSFAGNDVVGIGDAQEGLEHFSFNAVNSFSKGSTTKYFIRKGSGRGQVILHIPAFIPVQALQAPEEATNFKLKAHLVAISDFESNKQTEEFIACAPEDHGKVGSFESSMLPLLKIQTQPITAQVSTDRNKVLHEKSGLVLLIAVKFFKYSSGKFTHLPEKGIVEILKVL